MSVWLQSWGRPTRVGVCVLAQPDAMNEGLDYGGVHLMRGVGLSLSP